MTLSGSKSGYTTAAKTSAATKAVTAPLALTAAPVPTLTGRTVSGQKLTAVPGTVGSVTGCPGVSVEAFGGEHLRGDRGDVCPDLR